MASPPWLVATVPAGYRLLVHDTLDGTNAEAKRLAASGAAAGTVVVARTQAAGRGRHGRAWVSPPGNLYMSLLLRPDGDAAAAAQISFLAALAVHDVVAALAPAAAPLLKWPNDVLVDGAKISGILLESAADGRGGVTWAVIGIGLNLVHHPHDQARPATSLAALGRTGVEPAAALELLVARLDHWLGCWRRDGFAALRAAWLERSIPRGAPIAVRLGKTRIEGRFADLDPDGALIVELSDGRRQRIDAGDVFLPSLNGEPGNAARDQRQ